MCDNQPHDRDGWNRCTRHIWQTIYSEQNKLKESKVTLFLPDTFKQNPLRIQFVMNSNGSKCEPWSPLHSLHSTHIFITDIINIKKLRFCELRSSTWDPPDINYCKYSIIWTQSRHFKTTFFTRTVFSTTPGGVALGPLDFSKVRYCRFSTNNILFFLPQLLFTPRPTCSPIESPCKTQNVH